MSKLIKHIKEECIIEWDDRLWEVDRTLQFYFHIDDIKLCVHSPRNLGQEYSIRKKSLSYNDRCLPKKLNYFMRKYKIRGSYYLFSPEELLKILLQFDPEIGEKFMFCCLSCK